VLFGGHFVYKKFVVDRNNGEEWWIVAN
jgi:hypothetical protein